MQHSLPRKLLSVLMALVITLSLFAGLTANASAPSAASIGKNTAKRHEICTGLSDAAKAYYPAGSTYSDLIQLSGKKTNDSTEAIGSPLFNKLQSMMQPKDTISYSSLTSYWKYTDASEGSSDACLFYSDEISSSYNREHVWPKSHGNFYQSGAGSDIQHLRPTNATINSTRGHMTMGNVKAKTGYTVKTKDYEGKTVLWYISEGTYTDNGCLGLVEVADNVKGDVARIFLYVYTTYGAENANKNLFTTCGSYGSTDNDGYKVIESLDTLLEWCALDPVDEWEMMRNDLCQKVQGNRNIFIDYPELGWYLFGREDQIPGDMPTPSGMASGTTPSSYVITAVSNNEAWGTVQLTGKIIDASPAEGYFAAGYTVTSGEATVTQSGNRFSVSPKSDCTVQINFAAKDVCTVTYSANGETVATAPAYTGEKMTLPTSAPAVEDWRFIGWVLDPIDEAVTVKPSFYAAGADYTPTGDVTLYALYTMIDDGSTGETDSYQLLTAMPATLEGNYVLSSEDADYVLLCDGSEAVNANTAAIPLSGTGMSKDGDKLTDVTDRYVLVAEHVSGDNYAFRLKGSDTPLYLMTDDSNGGFKAVDSNDSTEAQWTVSINSGGAIISNAAHTSRSIRFNGSSMMFRTYTSGQQPVFLWKALEGGKVYYATSPNATACEHDYVAAVTPPACTTQGYTTYTCSICGRSYVGDYVPALGHDLSDWELVADPNCTEKGLEIRGCLRCEYTEEHEVAALGHDWLGWTEAKAPTCTETGEESNICDRCGAEETRDIPVLGHDWGEWKVTKAPTCTVKGVETRACTRCGETETREVPALGHDLSDWDLAEAPTCTEKGLEIAGCLRCEYTEEREIPALGHDWGAWTVTTAPNCTMKGKETRSCSRCSETETRDVDPLGHNFVNGVCTVCGLKESEAPEPGGNPFVDVPENAYYYEPVMWAVENGVTGGVDATHFGPNKTCTRAQVVTFLYAAAGKPSITPVQEGTGDDVDPEIVNPFEDVADNAYYHDAVLWAFSNGITGGVDKTHFGPGKTCTRAQVVTFLYSWKNKPAYSATENPFDDVAKTAYYYDAVMWAVENGVTGGTGPQTFGPNKYCTRAQVVTFLYKAK